MAEALSLATSDFLMPYAGLIDARSDAEALTGLQEATRDLGFDQLLFAVIPQPRTNPNDVYLRSNYPLAWRNQYEQQNMRAADPTVEYCFKSSAPMVWTPQSFKTKPQQQMYEEAVSFGLRVGVTLPIHGAAGEIGMLTCVRDQAPSQAFLHDLQRNLAGLSLLRDVAFDAMSKFIRTNESAEQAPALTAREMDCLQWMTGGKTAWEIGRILSISEAGVNFHISNLRTKFNVTKRNDVVLKAIRMGLVSMPG